MTLDPCPGAGRIAGLSAFQHPHEVTCGGCGRLIRFAWWDGTRHLCGRCHEAQERAEGAS